jgi:hypothetical protein
MFTEALGNGHLMFLTFPDLCAAPGGLPLVADGKLIGAIGRQRRRRATRRRGGAGGRGGAVVRPVAASSRLNRLRDWRA